MLADQIKRDVSIYVARGRPRSYMKVPGVDFSHQVPWRRYCLSCEQYPQTQYLSRHFSGWHFEGLRNFGDHGRLLTNFELIYLSVCARLRSFEDDPRTTGNDEFVLFV